jgi:hypothetical protein
MSGATAELAGRDPSSPARGIGNSSEARSGGEAPPFAKQGPVWKAEKAKEAASP